MKSICLIGYRAVGKSTLGAALAQELNIPKICTDTEIEKAICMTISAFIQKYDWEYFRVIESQVIAELCTKMVHPCIIVTGGGTIERSENMELLRKYATIYWLQLDADTIKHRLMQNPLLRPNLISNVSTIDEVDIVLRKRTPLYKKFSDHTINANSKTVLEICHEILSSPA